MFDKFGFVVKSKLNRILKMRKKVCPYQDGTKLCSDKSELILIFRIKFLKLYSPIWSDAKHVKISKKSPLEGDF